MDTAAAEITNNKMLGWRMRISAFVELTKPRIAFMLLLTTAAGFYLGTSGPSTLFCS
jgi:heme O synthase-like polyprenyltransferase